MKAGDNSEPFVEGKDKVFQGGNVNSLGNNYERDRKTYQDKRATSLTFSRRLALAACRTFELVDGQCDGWRTSGGYIIQKRKQQCVISDHDKSLTGLSLTFI